MQWKFCVVLLLFCFLFSPLYSESSEEFTVPDLIPTEEYVMKGQDIMTMYEELNNLNNLNKELLTVSKESIALNKEFGKENSQLQQQNQKLTLMNNFLIGTTVCSVGIVVAGAITLIVMNIN